MAGFPWDERFQEKAEAITLLSQRPGSITSATSGYKQASGST